ncbi:aquaporin-10-like [Tubulanus polymorphus]|uniref:aquaporin-10-like n=1 Tax=Tubulanus polymorphus TaxID=672921 RepID=UPI003DA4FD1E
MVWYDRFKNRIAIKSPIGRAFLAEILGTCLLCAFGNGSVAQSVLSNKEMGTYISVNWGYGLGAAMGVFVSTGASGGHLNPAVSLAMAVLGKLRWRYLPAYVIAQTIGSFLSSILVYFVYLDGLNNFDGGNRSVTGPLATAGIFSTYPLDHVTWATGLGDQIVGTMLLVICVLAVTDHKHGVNPSSGLVPVIVGFIVFLLGISFGYNCGYAINPARDLGPRIFTAIFGWGLETFSFRNYNWFWIPLIGPLIGGLLATVVYPLVIGIHLDNEVNDELVDIDEVKFSCSSLSYCTESNETDLTKL